jgi:hypothetical protein
VGASAGMPALLGRDGGRDGGHGVISGRAIK